MLTHVWRKLAALGLALSILFTFITAAPQAAFAAAPLNQTIWLRAVSSGKYVSADSNRGANTPLVADRDTADGWEHFQVVDAGNGNIGLRALANGKFVSADQNFANTPLVADRATMSGWEVFQWVDVTAGQVQLRSLGNNNFVSSDLNLGAHAPLVANRPSASGWETFNWGIVGANPTPIPTTPPGTTPDFGPNVLMFDPSMSTASIQNQINNVYGIQQNSQFGSERYTLMFKPGTYNGLNIPVGFYTQLLGVGASPDSVNINGSVYSNAYLGNDNATCNFWRGAEGLSITPANGTMQWAVSQAVPFRRMHIRGNMKLNQNNGWSSGGWMADVLVDGNVNSGTQQQWISRNTQWGSWTGSNWNMVFVGVTNPPAGNWPNPPYTKIDQTPIVREKPFVTVDAAGNWGVRVPSLRTNSNGITWAGGSTPGTTIAMSQFFIAKPSDSAATINAQLAAGKHLLFTPGIYALNDTIRVNNPNTVVLGLGFATLRPTTGLAAMTVADVDGVTIAGVLFDAGVINSPVLLEVGPNGSNANHAANPIVLHDVIFRVGGAAAGKASTSLRINSHNTIVDHTWVWRADHGDGVAWNSNTAANGLIVNGNNVTIYGLFVEHYQQYQVLWQGNGGRVYFYQSEIPYDPPTQDSWRSAAGVNGWASYKVADNVTSHEAWGLGIYSVFTNPNIWLTRAIEAPNNPNVRFHNMISVAIGANGGISNVINNTGGSTQTNVSYTPKVTNYP
ncbi:coagulation factor 5/8 type domain-containing protein [Herpetosiphon sp. NSE202]|uniref:coagulation factor 5/8 type domain-containing protein n=1 Tax=Herpetosiphon sp. NSE202 TaxID=3351349 RepID=UPI0036428607